MHATSMTNLKTLYVLRLAHRKWYVGTTGQSPRQRLATHQRRAGSAWTRTHPVQAMVHTMDVPAATAGILETAKTLELMRRHGVGNVRGGSYCQRVLTSMQIEDIERQLRHNDGRCLRCGRNGHFAPRCYARTHSNGGAIDAGESESETESSSDDDSCHRCGRDGHYASGCYARTSVDGRRL